MRSDSRDPGQAAWRLPELRPYDEDWLAVGDGHRLHFEQFGNPAGLPLVVLHGGPGSGYSARQRTLFDPALFRSILFDQRGCGLSTPRGELRANTTAHLVADVERLRAHLGIARWLVVGGSWGASLGIAYAAAHRAACLGLILRGVFLTGEGDLDWFAHGAGQLVPDAWEDFASFAPGSRRQALLGCYAEAIAGADPARAAEAVLRWQRYEAALTCPGSAPPPVAAPPPAELPRLIDKYRIQTHYLLRQCFLGEARLLADLDRLRGLPCALLHGRLDFVCRPQNAWRVQRALPGSQLTFVAGVGHDPFAPAMVAALDAALRRFAGHGDFAAPAGTGRGA